MNFLTTAKLTSASNKASLTSRMASFTSFSLSLPRPDSFLNTVCSLEESPSNAIVHHLHYVLDQPLGFSVFLHAG